MFDFQQWIMHFYASYPGLSVPCLSGKTEYQATHGGRLRRASTFERRPSKRYPSRTQSLGKGEASQHMQMIMTNSPCLILCAPACDRVLPETWLWCTELLLNFNLEKRKLSAYLKWFLKNWVMLSSSYLKRLEKLANKIWFYLKNLLQILMLDCYTEIGNVLKCGQKLVIPGHRRVRRTTISDSERAVIESNENCSLGTYTRQAF